jgi:hypothetical protein
MDADAKLDAALGRKAGIALDHAVLDLYGAADGVDDAAKLDNAAIPGALDDATVMDVGLLDRSGRCGVPAAAQVSAPHQSQQACCTRPHRPPELLRVSAAPTRQSPRRQPD